jgi:hypothetical protein
MVLVFIFAALDYVCLHFHFVVGFHFVVAVVRGMEFLSSPPRCDCSNVPAHLICYAAN